MAITTTTQKVLWAQSHNVCAFTLCVQPLTENKQDGGGSVPVGEQAHIRSGRPNGPRHDPRYADVDGLDNLILLCPTHHTLIDSNNGRNFTVAQLEQMKAQHTRQQDKRAKFTPAVLAYLADRYGAEDFVQFQQAELKAHVSAMFVDVPLGCRADSSVAALVERIATAHPGDSTLPTRSRKLLVAGAAQLLLHPEWSEDAVLVGGPGQGKSTILQYIAQYYRSRRLRRTTYDAQDGLLVRNSGLARIPIRLDLRRYAQWRRSQQERVARDGGDARDARTHLERYVLSDIQRHTGTHEFSADDFELMLATEPVAIALDGLDEIPNVLDRDDVTVEIARARDRLKTSAANLIVLVSTRPGSSLNTLTESGLFTVLQVLPLTRGLRRQYLRRWIEVNALEAGPADRITAAYHGNEHLAHIEELASSPMQLAILLHLLHRRQLLPEQRTELFRNYLESFLDREQTEDKEPLLAQHRNVLVETHAYLGWYLHSRTEQGELQGGIEQEELRRVLHRRLEDNPDAREIADALYSAITSRVLCLIEREGKFEFEVQSLREYFAAWHLFENLSSRGVGDSRDDGATALLSRGYWTNVTRFFLGMLTKGEIRSLHDNLAAADSFVAPHPLVRATTILSLQDRVYQSQPTAVVEKAVAFVLDGPGVALGESGLLDLTRIPLMFGERAGRTEAVRYLRSRLARGDGPLRAVASSLYRHDTSSDDLATWWWERFTPTTVWLEVASSLRALRDPNPEDNARLTEALRVASDEHVHIASLLIDGGFEGDAEPILRAVIAEQNRGIIAATDRTTPVAVLSRIGDAIVARDWSAMPRGNRDVPDTLGAREAARALLSPRSTGDVDALMPIANVWGGGWILSCAVGSAPATAALDRVTSNPALNSALRAEHSFRSHASDAGWWKTAWTSATTESEQDLHVLGLLSHAQQHVLVASLPELETAIAAMSVVRYAAVFRTLSSRHGVFRGRRLPLDEAVRTGLRPSGPLLWLLRAISTEPTGWIDKRLERQLASIVTAGIEPAEVFSKVTPRRSVPIDAVHKAALEDLPPGVTVEGLGADGVDKVMSNPDQWPAQIVESAINALEIRRSKQMKPLLDVARESEWNVG